MKKLLKPLLLILACVLALCAFAACDMKSGDGENDKNSKVTATQWESALSTNTKFTIEVSFNGTVVVTVKVDGDKWHNKSGSDERILSKEDNEHFEYKYDGSVWTRTSLDEDDYIMYTKNYVNMPSFFKNDYSAFTYAEGKYTCASIDKKYDLNAVFENAEITFNDGKLVDLVFEVSEDSDITRYEIKNIGNTTVTLPTNYSDGDQNNGGGIISEEEWKAALSKEAFCNVTVSRKLYGLNLIGKTDLSKDIYSSYDGSGDHTIFSIENGEYFKYEKKAEDEKYTKSNTTSTSYERLLWDSDMFMVIDYKDMFDEFTYNEETGTYIGLGINVKGDNYTYDLEFKFENGKLVYADITLEEDEHLIIEYYDYGTTEIEMPEDYIDNIAN